MIHFLVCVRSIFARSEKKVPVLDVFFGDFASVFFKLLFFG